MDLANALSSGSLVALPLAFAGGLAMGLNPCCLALYPAAAATCCAGACDADSPRPAVSNAIAFVLGTATATTILGIVAALAGRTLEGFGGWVRYGIALVPIVMGLHLLGWMRLPMPRGAIGLRGRGVHGAYASGLLLSLVIGPCGTPGMGNGAPLVIAGTASGRITTWLSKLGWRAWMERVAGVLMLAVGGFLLWTA